MPKEEHPHNHSDEVRRPFLPIPETIIPAVISSKPESTLDWLYQKRSRIQRDLSDIETEISRLEGVDRMVLWLQ